MSDILPAQIGDVATGPKCPVCGGQTMPMAKHKAVEAQTIFYRCVICHVQYPVAKTKQAPK